MWPLCGLNRANVENILVYLQNKKLYKIELNITSKSLIYSGLDLLCLWAEDPSDAKWFDSFR